MREHFSRFVGPVNRQSSGTSVHIVRLSKREIIRAIFSVLCCGGDCMEDLNLYRHGGKLLPIHRGIAAYGCPLWNQGHRQSQEFSVQIHRRPCQVDQNGTTIQTQHLLQQTIQHNLGARID